MLSFCHSFRNLQQYRSSLIDFLNVSDTGNTVNYPPSIANGFSVFLRLHPCLSCQIVNYTTSVDIMFDRLPVNEDCLLIVFKNLAYRFENGIYTINNSVGSAQVSTTSHREQILLSAGANIKALKICIRKKYFKQLLESEEHQEQLRLYIESTENTNDRHFLSAEQAAWLNEITDTDLNTPMREWYVRGRVYLLLESFIREVLTQQTPALVHTDERYRLKLIREYLKEHYHEAFPGISWLCRYACLSRTRLLNRFKQVYGLSPGEFHQKNRLQVAHDLLASGTYTISEIANLLEYRNFSNFTSAFKKEFGYLPSCLTGQ